MLSLKNNIVVSGNMAKKNKLGRCVFLNIFSDFVHYFNKFESLI